MERNEPLEFYSFISNVDNSILKINPLLRKHGYEFVSVSISELSDRFSDLFPIPIRIYEQKKEDEDYIRLQLMLKNPFFQFSDFKEDSLIFFKKTNLLEPDCDYWSFCSESQQFTENLIQKFRYFKNGDVERPLLFLIGKKTRLVHTVLWGRTSASSISFGFDSKAEIDRFSKFFSQKLKTNDLIELADASFNVSYEIRNPKVKFATFMMALESIFNQGKDQIAHTISRHLALLISDSHAEFSSNYNKIKGLYNLRNSIIHGSSNTKENRHITKSKKYDLNEKNQELQNLVRAAINHCRNLNMSKKELFDDLNAKGAVTKMQSD